MRKIPAIFFLALILPSFAFAQANTGFSRNGIFGCSRNASALDGSVGAFSATAGVFVPVADNTVELNTGTLVYQQCVLRGIVDRESEAVNASQIQKTVQMVTTGNNGNAYFETQPHNEFMNVQDQRTLTTLKDQSLVSAMNPAFASQVQSAAARSYMQQTRNRQAELNCPDNGSNATGLDALLPMINPACYDIGAYNIYTNFIQSDVNECLQYVQDQLEYGRGFYAVVQGDICDGGKIQTPSSYVEEEGLQAITSGFRRVESANDIDQMVGALYAGLGTQVLTGSGGLLSGLTTPIGNSPSYLSQLTSESQQGLRNAAANAALQILASARTIEAQYNQTFTNIAKNLTTNINLLRSTENQCLGLIAFNTSAKHVCTAAPTGATCTDLAGNNLTNVASTSTQFSQPIITAQIQPAALQVAANLQKSNDALSLIDQLIAGVTNTTSLDAQRLALVQLDQLVAQGKLHVQADVTAAQQQQSSVADTLTQLQTDTKTLWADNNNFDAASGSGWCNVNNQAVIDFWDGQWK
jgi:hypothetical protein